MSHSLPVRIGLSAATILALGVVAGGGPAIAADSPEAAVNELFDIVASGDFSALDAAVCAADRDAISETFDLGAQLGLASDDPLASALTIAIDDRSVELVEQEGDSATAAVSATMSMSVPEDQINDLVRAILTAELGPDDPPPSDDDVEMMAGFMGSAFNQSQRLDEEITLVREDGEWLVCGGLVEPQEPVAAEQPWPSEGMCGLLDMDAVNAVGTLQYTSASGFETVCSITSSIDDFDAYHTATLSLNEGYDYETFQGAFGMDEELEVAGYPAFAAGDQVFVQVDDDVLQVSVYPGEEPPAGVDAVTQAVGLAELVIPRLSEIATPTPEPTPEPAPEVPLCEDLTLDELNELTGLGFDQADGDAFSCQFLSISGERGFHFVNVYTNEAELDLYTLWLPEYEETTVAGLPALVTEQQTIVQLPDGQRVLDITVALDASDEAVSVSASEVAAVIAERLLPSLMDE